jgi:organic radical activating enzyme
MLKLSKSNRRSGLKNADCIKKLNRKMFGIHITNVCNLHCGGCDQFCGYFNKEKHFYISLDELKNNIENFTKYRIDNWNASDFPEDDKLVLLYGGEPTLHPEFNAILNLLYEYEDIPFCIYTNGRSFASEHFKHIDLDVTGTEISRAVYRTDTLPRNGYPKFSKLFSGYHAHEKNVTYRIDYKTSESRNMFAPVLCSPTDLETDNKLNQMEMWERIKKDYRICYKWNKCENSIYNNKAYVCNVAASMDNMFYGGKHGWDVEKGKNPFDKTEQEIDDQMENFCYRCGYNCPGGMGEFENKTDKNQYVHKGTMVTDTNLKDMDKKSPCCNKIELVQIAENKIPKKVFR